MSKEHITIYNYIKKYFPDLKNDYRKGIYYSNGFNFEWWCSTKNLYDEPWFQEKPVKNLMLSIHPKPLSKLPLPLYKIIPKIIKMIEGPIPANYFFINHSTGVEKTLAVTYLRNHLYMSLQKKARNILNKTYGTQAVKKIDSKSKIAVLNSIIQGLLE